MVDLLPDFSLLRYNTFGFNVQARYACVIEQEAQLPELLAETRLVNLPRLIIGDGSNLVLTNDFPGVAWLMRLSGRRLVQVDDEAFYIEAAAGENWHELVRWSLQQGYPGLENLALIPGTVGAAPIQNIGAYGLEIAEYFDSLRALDLTSGALLEFQCEQCEFAYRNSLFKQASPSRYLILSVRFRLPKQWQPRASYSDVAQLLAAQAITQPNAYDIFNAVVEIRRAKLPDPTVVGNAGSFFKNPIVSAAQHAELKARLPDLVSYPLANGDFKLAAAWLIEHAGWKGRALGGAAVHERQALVLVNQNDADGRQVLALAHAIQESIAQYFGVELEIEPTIV